MSIEFKQPTYSFSELSEGALQRKWDKQRCWACANYTHGCHGTEGPCGAFTPKNTFNN